MKSYLTVLICLLSYIVQASPNELLESLQEKVENGKTISMSLSELSGEKIQTVLSELSLLEESDEVFPENAFEGVDDWFSELEALSEELTVLSEDMEFNITDFLDFEECSTSPELRDFSFHLEIITARAGLSFSEFVIEEMEGLSEQIEDWKESYPSGEKHKIEKGTFSSALSQWIKRSSRTSVQVTEGFEQDFMLIDENLKVINSIEACQE